jgi:hypothetical protein
MPASRRNAEAVETEIGPVTAAPTPRAQEQYCDVCWAVVPADASACLNCGRTLQEMETERAQRAATDRSWSPPRAREGLPEVETVLGAAPEVQSSPTGGRVKAEPSSFTTLKKAKPKLPLIPVAGGAAVVVMAGVLWVTVLKPADKTSTPTPPAPKAGQTARSSPSLKPTAVTKAPAEPPVPLRWANPYTSLKLSLLGPGRTVLASDPGGGADSVSPGTYRVRVTAADRKWPGAEAAVTIGKDGVVRAPAKIVASYYLWSGARWKAAAQPYKAEGAWRMALAADPKNAQARALLVALMNSQGRRDEAQSLLKASRR